MPSTARPGTRIATHVRAPEAPTQTAPRAHVMMAEVIDMIVPVEIRDQFLAERHTAVVRGEIARTQLEEWLRAGYRDVTDYLCRHRIRSVGPPFARYTVLGETVAVEGRIPRVRAGVWRRPGAAIPATHRSGRRDDPGRAARGSGGRLSGDAPVAHPPRTHAGRSPLGDLPHRPGRRGRLHPVAGRCRGALSDRVNG